MFSSLTERLKREIETLKLVLDTHDGVRDLLFRPMQQTATEEQRRPMLEIQEAISSIKKAAPSKLPWQVYDHCAAFTRLYAVYEQFVEDLITEYLKALPKLYPKYDDLPTKVITQHRVGIGQILLKLGKDGPYKLLEEREIIKDLSHGLLGNPNYLLLRDAFLIDPQNYRAEALNKVFSYVGFDDCWTWVEKHPGMVLFMQGRRDPENETPKSLLRDFVENRNLASHTQIANIVATEEIKAIADFVMAICEALAQLVMKQVVQKMRLLGQALPIGEVIHKFRDRIVGVRLSAGILSTGDAIIVMQRHSCFTTRIESMRIDQTPMERLELQQEREVGLRFTASVNEGAQLLKLASDPQPLGQPAAEPSSPDEFPLQTTSTPEEASFEA